MNIFLTLAFLFFIGSVFGWILELFYRRFFSRANPSRKWINPGFCTGPYLPLYGSGLCLLYLIASAEKFLPFESPVLAKICVFAIMAVCMTLIEYISGYFALRFYKIRLWDYTGEWGNIKGIICPKFSLFWAILGAAYYFAVHPHILDAVAWLANNLTFSFVIGMFFGIFIVDAVQSARLVSKLKAFAKEKQIILRFEDLKSQIRERYDAKKKKYHFFSPFKSDIPLEEHIKNLIEKIESANIFGPKNNK